MGNEREKMGGNKQMAQQRRPLLMGKVAQKSCIQDGRNSKCRVY